MVMLPEEIVEHLAVCLDAIRPEIIAHEPARFGKPLDTALVNRLAREHELLITVEEGSIGGFASHVLHYLALSGLIEIWQILVLSVFLGTVNTFDVTGRQVFLSEMLDDRADLANAIALNSSMFNGARLVGPALAGVLRQ